MVFTAVTDNGRVIPPLFAPPGLRIGTIEYLAIMEEVLVPGLGHHSNLKDMAPGAGLRTRSNSSARGKSPEAEDTQARAERGMAP